MGRVALVVELDIAPERLDEFLAIVRPHGARSLEVEEGCLRFEVMIPRGEPDRVMLVELYADDEAAFPEFQMDRTIMKRLIRGRLM